MVDPIRPEAPTAVPGPNRHLDLDALNAVLDGALDPVDRAAAEAHLAGCAACAADLAELRATVGLLRRLPQYRPRRDFTLGPEHAIRPRSVDETDSPRFLPSPPAMRVATLAVAALLLLAVVGEWTFGRPSEPTASVSQQAPAAAPVLAPTTLPAPAAPAVREAAPAANEAAPAEDAAPAAERALAPATGGFESAGDGVDEAEGTGGASRASEKMDGGTPASAPRPGPTPWRLAQIGLGLTLLWLLVSLVGIEVVRRIGRGAADER